MVEYGIKYPRGYDSSRVVYMKQYGKKNQGINIELPILI